LPKTSPALLQPVRVDIRRITLRDQLDNVIQVEEQVLGGDFGWIRKRMEDHLEIPDYVSIYVAYIGERPTCTGWVYWHRHSQFASLHGGATLPDYRRQGLYTSVLAIRVQEAIQRGYRYLTIEASPASHLIVARHGFRLLTHVNAYEWKGSPEA
jgi:GNAT superfamily N-acetyltransferase